MVGCALLAYGLGTIVQSWVFNKLIATLGIVSALNTTAIGLTAAGLLPTLFLSWPPSTAPDGRALATPAEAIPLFRDSDADDTSIRLPWGKLVRLRSFWLYNGAVFSAGAAYALTPFFFKLGHVFGKPDYVMVTIFQVIGAMATVVGLVGGWAADVMRFGTGFFRSGAKNMTIICMVVQTVLFAALVPLSNTNNFWGFTVASGILIIITASHYASSAILANDFFGAVNSCLVFGIGAGLAIGLGEGLSAELMSAVEAGRDVNVALTPGSYSLFYVVGVIWSMIGLICILAVEGVRTCK